jgi:hypothetical protein
VNVTIQPYFPNHLFAYPVKFKDLQFLIRTLFDDRPYAHFMPVASYNPPNYPIPCQVEEIRKVLEFKEFYSDFKG